MWGCGDRCECAQPIVQEGAGPNPDDPWHWHRIWGGTFVSGYSDLDPEERVQLDDELREACVRLEAVNLDQSLTEGNIP